MVWKNSIGKYEVVYKAGWIWPVYIDVNISMQNGFLHARVTNDSYDIDETYKLIPVPGKENEITVEGIAI